MANRNDSHMATTRRVKRMLAMMEVNGEISDAHRRGEVLRIFQAAHNTWQRWHKKMLTSNDNIDFGNDNNNEESKSKT